MKGQRILNAFWEDRLWSGHKPTLGAKISRRVACVSILTSLDPQAAVVYACVVMIRDRMM
jgi:hypothetical protein